MQAPLAAHTSEQLPLEQFKSHGGLAHSPAQLPPWQLQVLPVHVAGARAPASVVSGMAGPPLGVPVLVLVEEEPHATAAASPKESARRVRIEASARSVPRPRAREAAQNDCVEKRKKNPCAFGESGSMKMAPSSGPVPR